MSNFVVAGFDKWCRIKSGLSNAKIAEAISTQEHRFSAEEIRAWREGGGIPEPSVTLLPLRVALKGPWPPATAEESWLELVEILKSAVPYTGTPSAAKADSKLIPTRATAPRPRVAAAPKTNPEVDACRAEIERTAEELKQEANLADQVQAGWFKRTSEKYKKYLSSRDLKHRKAYLVYCLQKAETTLQKTRARRDELAARLEALSKAIGVFDGMQEACTQGMQRNRDSFVELWRELKQVAPLVALARQTHEKGTSKSLANLEDVLQRAESAISDLQSKLQAISEPEGISLAWLTPESKLGQRLRQQYPKAEWAKDFDPFEGCCLCKDKLADRYKVAGSHKQEKPVEIDLACEIDLTVVDVTRRQEAVKSLLSI